jgi:hypothetical protein
MKEWLYRKLLARATKKYDKHREASISWQRSMCRCEYEIDRLERIELYSNKE